MTVHSQDAASAELIGHVNEYLSFYVAVADAKAGAIARASGVALVVLGDHLETRNLGAALFGIGAAIAFVVALALAVTCLFPRRPSHGDSLVFWEDIARKHPLPDSYVAAWLAATDDQIAHHLITQNYWVARVLATKYRLLRWSIATAMVGLACILAAFGFSR